MVYLHIVLRNASAWGYEGLNNIFGEERLIALRTKMVILRNEQKLKTATRALEYLSEIRLDIRVIAFKI